MSTDHSGEPIRGKATVSGLLFNFLVPLHVMAEVGDMRVIVRATPIPEDFPNRIHSAWTLDLTAPSGAECTLTWSVLRRWSGSRVVYECHYDHQQTGGPLTFQDLRFDELEAGAGALFAQKQL